MRVHGVRPYDPSRGSVLPERADRVRQYLGARARERQVFRNDRTVGVFERVMEFGRDHPVKLKTDSIDL